LAIETLYQAFKNEFDLVSIIDSDRYVKLSKEYGISIPNVSYNKIIALGLAYPKRVLKSTNDTLYGSIYTFGTDYHTVMKDKIKKVMSNFDYKYELGVDNHPHNDRLAALASGLGFFGKNQLIINKDYGSFFFLGMVFLNIDDLKEIYLENSDSCGDCRICIDACPTNALSENGYDYKNCISYFNQEKKVLNDSEIKANYCLFGCDICQLICPKNISLKSSNFNSFELSGKEGVSIEDLFNLSEKEFKIKYENMAYLWKGKTVLLRNGLTLLLRQNNSNYNHFIEESLKKYLSSWYQETAKNILKKLANK
jgi:epoxyqueuosine reductase